MYMSRIAYLPEIILNRWDKIVLLCPSNKLSFHIVINRPTMMCLKGYHFMIVHA
jgi:hypothetical protein